MRLIKVFLLSIFFYPMLFCRGIAVRCCGILSFLLFALFVFMSLTELITLNERLVILAGSFGCFMIGWSYDWILLRLNPGGNDIILY